ncbi:hypothetical protein BDF14DRAFT_501131 [Spinellus fusiger]|nr:hypothetical protein BDF14DRAFT_501131 [Spinellus fusiger]
MDKVGYLYHVYPEEDPATQFKNRFLSFLSLSFFLRDFLLLSSNLTCMADSQSPLLSRDRIDNHDGHSENSEDAVSNTDYGSGVYRYPVYLQPGQFTSLEKLMFFVSSILFILLCVFTGLYARSSYNENPKKSPHPPVPIPLPPTKNTTEALCLEPHCIQSAASILQVIRVL